MRRCLTYTSRFAGLRQAGGFTHELAVIWQTNVSFIIIVYYATRVAHSNSYIQYKHTVKS